MGSVKYLVIMWAAAFVFFMIGVYATKKKKPMRIGGGVKISELKIKNVKKYNREIARLWYAFSVFFFISGIIEFFLPVFSIIVLVATATVGIGAVIWYCHKIEEK